MLKQLRLNRSLQMKRDSLKTYLDKEADIQKRSDDLQKSLEEAETDEDLKLIDDEIENLEEEKKENDESKKTVEQEIEDIEKELEDVEERSSSAAQQTQKRAKGEQKNMNRIQVRELIKTGEYYERSDVKEFYEKFKNLRAVGGGELTIPHTVINRIMDIMGDYTTLYPLVDKIRVQGTTRILVDTDTTPATWVEQSSPIPVGEVGTITNIDFDGFKVGKVTFVDNYLLQDSIINLDDYVTKKIARAIALALDIAIVNGKGASEKQPLGILTSLPARNKVEVAADTNLLKSLIKNIGLIDTGLDAVGEIVAVMSRQTYYNRLVEFSIQVDASGNVVGKLPNLRQPDLLGYRVVFNNSLPVDAVLYGDFSKYTLVERESITIDNSEHVKFVEDQTAFRGKGRFDGKPTRPSAFALVTITDGAGVEA